MASANRDFAAEIESTLDHTTSYALDPKWRIRWLGFTEESRNLKSQQLRAFAELLGSVTISLSGWRILDIGCGDGRWLRTFLEYDAKPEDVIGIDVSDERFNIGRAKNPLITLMKNDGVTIPSQDESFDLVTQFVCFSSIPTVALRSQVAKEILRVMKPGGYIFWWDLPYTVSPIDKKERLQSSEYFSFPIRELWVGKLPLPGECLRPFKTPGIRRILKPVLNCLGYPSTHIAALIGPKPL